MDNWNETETFCVKAYMVSELAEYYNPHLSPAAAWKQLRRWILFNPSLQEELKSLGYGPGIRCLTPKQVGCIVKYLGTPW